MVAETWDKEGAVGELRPVPKEFVLHSGRIEGATRLTVMEASIRVKQRKGRLSPDAFMVYVRGNMEGL